MKSFKKNLKIHNPLPESLASECSKAASILNHFIKGKNQLDSTLIPPKILNNAKGVAVITILKAGMLFSGRAGSGLVVAKLPDGRWSAPSAIATAGAGFGAQIGAQLTDCVFILNTWDAVKAFSHGGNVTLGGNLSVAAGPLGRSTEAAGTIVNLAPIYSYSKTRGLFAGLSLEGSVIITRNDANTNFYNKKVSAKEILSGAVEPPAAADPLYRALNIRFGGSVVGKECEKDGDSSDNSHGVTSSSLNRPYYNKDSDTSNNNGYGKLKDSEVHSPPPYSSSSTTKNANTRNVDLNPYTTYRRAGAVISSDMPIARSSTVQAHDVYSSTGSLSEKPIAPSAEAPFSYTASSGSSTVNRKPPPPPVPSRHTKPKRAVAMHDYNAEQSGDLSFKKGDLIEVTKSTDSSNDWWTGRVNGFEGVFPANYVQLS